MQKKLIFIIMFFTFTSCLLAQVKIKERVEIEPIISKDMSDGQISDDPRNPCYLRYGGEVEIITITDPYYSNLEFWEESLGKISDLNSTKSLGIFPQWHKFVFYILNTITEERYYPNYGSDQILDFSGSQIYFYIYSDESEPPDALFGFYVYEDYSLAAMPPDEILNYYGNPFIPSSPIIAPIDGELFSVITDSDGEDELWLDLPNEKILQNDLTNHEDDTLFLGKITSGENVRFFLRSSHSIVAGMNLYPKIDLDQRLTLDGDLLVTTLNFENQTDLLYDNAEVELYIKPDNISDYPQDILVSLQNVEISPGDTALIDLKLLNEGEYIPFLPDQMFDVEIIKGTDYATLYSPEEEDTSDYLSYTQEGFSFIAMDNVPEEGADVMLRVITYIDEEPIFAKAGTYSDSLKNNSGNDKDIPLLTAPGGREIVGFLDIKLKSKEEHTILLGETKYYQAKYPDPTSNKLIIEEVKPGSDGVPNLNGGLNTDVWEGNPVSVVSCDSCGTKMGVYWETEKPVWDGNTNKGDLAEGLIRLVGRYWAADSTYIIKLKAKKNNDSAEVKIKVVKPARLYSESPTFRKSRDVFDEEYDVDSLCIYWGGLYGVPPQLIKGHIKNEAPPRNFPNYTGFAPSYAYEPYTTQFEPYVADKVKNKSNYFLVTDDGMGAPGAALVPNSLQHKYIKYIHYYTSETTVWGFLIENSQLVNINNTKTQFGAQYNSGNKKGRIIPSSNYSILKKYGDYLPAANKMVRDKYKIGNKTALSELQQVEANDSARVAFLKYLQYDWGGKYGNSKPKNLDSIWAQTRIASSYGLLQNLYETALQEGYDTTLTDKPENLNEPEGFKYNIFHYNTLFKVRNKLELRQNNWVSKYKGYTKLRVEGFEGALRVMIYYWNPGKKNYLQEVFNNAKTFLPRR